ncbi:hypothetical protein CY34DRAFT_812887, partial [Suillus luteus UH-Slu-Lm8-n1]
KIWNRPLQTMKLAVVTAKGPINDIRRQYLPIDEFHNYPYIRAPRRTSGTRTPLGIKPR